MKIPSPLRMRDDDTLAQFIETLCTTCRACPNLISLSPDTEDCDRCATSKKRPLSQTSNSTGVGGGGGGSECVSPVIPEKRSKTPSISEKISIKQEVATSTTTANTGMDSGSASISNNKTIATSSTTNTLTHFNQSNMKEHSKISTNTNTIASPATPTSSTCKNQQQSPHTNMNISSSNINGTGNNYNNNDHCTNTTTTNGNSGTGVLPNNVHIKMEPTAPITASPNTNSVQQVSLLLTGTFARFEIILYFSM